MLPCLLVVSGCATTNVAVEPLALPKVSSGLMRDPGDTPCHLPTRDLYHPSEVGAYLNCVKMDRENLHKRLLGLQRAVRVRESAIDKAKKANKT